MLKTNLTRHVSAEFTVNENGQEVIEDAILAEKEAAAANNEEVEG